MKRLITVVWRAWVIVLLATSVALAQGGAGIPPPPPPSKSWVLPYFLVGLCVFLGLLVAGRSAHRRDEVRPTD